jgi:hypothetical protein
MAGLRTDLQTLLENLQHGVSVYFQPPPNVQMTYPAIVYNRDYGAVTFADNGPYANKKRYQVMVIDPDPDSLIPDKVEQLPLTKIVRHFTTANLNHDIFQLYF